MRSLCHTNFEVGLLVLSALRALSLDTPCTEGKTSCESTAMNALSKASNAAQSPVLSRDMGRSTQRPWVIRSSTTARTTYECYEGYLGITILPPGELTAEVGKPYNVACLIDPKLGLQAEDVDFTCDGSPIPETESHDNRIDATISSAEQGRYNLVCQGGEKVCWRSLRVGYPPLDVENLTCISRNWQALECSWTVPENAAHPASEDYRPYLAGALGHESCDLLYGCRPQDDHECCVWTNATYSPSAEDIQIYFVTQNPLGTATFRHNFSNFAIVLPNPPEKVTSEEKTPLRIQVTWQTPFSLREFPPGLLYRIDHRVSDVQAPPPFLAKEGHYGSSSAWGEEIAVPYPGVAYQIEVRLRSAARAPAPPDLWEDGWSSAVARTAVASRPRAPWTSPEVGLGTYQVKVENFGVMDLLVMWRPLPRLLHNGPGLRYVVTCVDLSNDNIANKTVKEPSATFTHLYPNRPYRVTIHAQNDLGPSNVTSEVVVGTGLPAAPRLPVVVYHQDLDRYELRWREEDGLSYTVYVCTNQSLPGEPCQGDLSWMNVGNVSAVNVTLQEMDINPTSPRVHFALSAETADGVSSGMSWDSCVSPEVYNTLRTPPTIQGTNPKSSSVEVSWAVGCHGRAGVIEKLEAICYHYNSTQCTEDEPCMTSQGDGDSETVVFDNLQPSTNYTVRLRLLYRSGLSEWSVPAPFTTEDPQPRSSLPLWLIAMIVSGSVLALVAGALGGRVVARTIIKTHENLSRPIVLPQGPASGEERPKPQPSNYQRKNITAILKSLNEAKEKYPQDEDRVDAEGHEGLTNIGKTGMDITSNGGVSKQTEHRAADNIRDVAPPDTSNHAYVRLSGYLEDFVKKTEDNTDHDGLQTQDRKSEDVTLAVINGYVVVNCPPRSQGVNPISSQPQCIANCSSSEDEEARASHPSAAGSRGYVQCSVTESRVVAQGATGLRGGHTNMEMKDILSGPHLGNAQPAQPRHNNDTKL